MIIYALDVWLIIFFSLPFGASDFTSPACVAAAMVFADRIGSISGGSTEVFLQHHDDGGGGGGCARRTRRIMYNIYI